jgi:hypothetical protein
MKILRKLAITGAVILTVLGLGVGSAQATVINGCPERERICLYNAAGYSSALGNYYWFAETGSYACHNLPGSGQPGWPNGKVTDRVSSLILNWTGTNLLEWNVYFYDALNCSTSQGYFYYNMIPQQVQKVYNLTNIGWNDRIASFKVTF